MSEQEQIEVEAGEQKLRDRLEAGLRDASEGEALAVAVVIVRASGPPVDGEISTTVEAHVCSAFPDTGQTVYERIMQGLGAAPKKGDFKVTDLASRRRIIRGLGAAPKKGDFKVTDPASRRKK